MCVNIPLITLHTLFHYYAVILVVYVFIATVLLPRYPLANHIYFLTLHVSYISSAIIPSRHSKRWFPTAVASSSL